MTREEKAVLKTFDIACEILTTPDLVLRAPTEDDVQEIATLANNHKISSMLDSIPFPYFDADAQKFVEHISKPNVGECVFAITNAGTGELMGMCGLHLIDRRFELPHMGYWIGEGFWGKGYATQAARAVVDLFFKVGTEDTLLMSVLETNQASRRVIEKCGGEFWHQDTRYSTHFDKEMKVDHFRITRESWVGAVAA
ncbi:MAG: GNAT family N-acetyltransferase [Pseudomonadota bacterium]